MGLDEWHFGVFVNTCAKEISEYLRLTNSSTLFSHLVLWAIWGVMGDLVPFGQFKKHEKKTWRSDTFVLFILEIPCPTHVLFFLTSKVVGSSYFSFAQYLPSFGPMQNHI